MKTFKILSIVRISMMTVIIILCSWISIPFPIPFTMQTFGIYTALLLIGGKEGLLSVLLYILLGTAGLPVFSGFSAGAGHLLSPTGGYIWGFVLCALLYLFTVKFTSKSNVSKGFVLFAGTLLCYTAGTLWFVISSNNTSPVWSIITFYVFPYIIPDSAKLISAIFISKKLKPIISKTIKE